MDTGEKERAQCPARGIAPVCLQEIETKITVHALVSLSFFESYICLGMNLHPHPFFLCFGLRNIGSEPSNVYCKMVRDSQKLLS